MVGILIILHAVELVALVALIRGQCRLSGMQPPWVRLGWRLRSIWARRSRGLGDTVAKLTETVGIRPCAGCEERRQALNEAVPYGNER